MLYTSAEAAKLLRRLNDDKEILENMEAQSNTFTASLGEDVESVRPDYNYYDVNAKIKELDQKIRHVKHMINSFNVSTIVPEFNMTVDQILIYIPQLTKLRTKLNSMQNRLPKQREGNYNNIIDYRYINYDIDAVKNDYAKVSDELARAQTALDVLNNSVKFEIDI